MQVTCEHCFKTFNSNILFSNISLPLHMFVTDCPYCGKQTRMGQGQYNFDENGIAALLSEIPREDLFKIQAVAKKALSHNNTANEFKAAIEEINPVYKTLFDKFIEGITVDRFVAFLGLLISLLAYFHPLGSDTPISPNQTIINNYNFPKDESYSKNFEKILREKNLNNSNKRTLDKAKHKQRRKP